MERVHLAAGTHKSESEIPPPHSRNADLRPQRRHQASFLIGFLLDAILCRRFQGVDQPPRTAPFGGVSVRSTLSLSLSSQHHNQRVICQAYSPELAEGANAFFRLSVLCK